MATTDYELGVIYERDGGFYLAVGPRMLLTGRGGRWRELSANLEERARRHMTVAQLCERWGIPVSRFDEHVARYFGIMNQPSLEPKRHRSVRWRDPNWQAFRTVRTNFER